MTTLNEILGMGGKKTITIDDAAKRKITEELDSIILYAEHARDALIDKDVAKFKKMMDSINVTEDKIYALLKSKEK